jgi:hypothetical protein
MLRPYRQLHTVEPLGPLEGRARSGFALNVTKRERWPFTLDAPLAYSDDCRTPIPIHIGQAFQFKADTRYD